VLYCVIASCKNAKYAAQDIVISGLYKKLSYRKKTTLQGAL